VIYSKSCICYNQYALQKSLKKRKRSNYFFDKSIKMIKLAWNLRIEHRPYQSQATEWALAKGQAVCSLPTGRCEREHLSLRQAVAKTGLNHATIGDIIRGRFPSPETIKKLAQGFGDGTNERVALEDRLLVLAGYRTPQPEEELSEPQIKMIVRFADFLIEIEEEK
jgi:transcriptional regulator with XRE-family HTH domain